MIQDLKKTEYTVSVMSTVTLNFGRGLQASVNTYHYTVLRETTLNTFENSHSDDKIGIKNALSAVTYSEPRSLEHVQLARLTLRLALKLGILGPGWFPLSNRFDADAPQQFKRFLLDIGKFYRADQNAYDISGDDTFTSLDDGTFYGVSGNTNTNQFQPADPRVAKVKRVLQRHLGRVPTDRDIDTFSYMYFGSDAFPHRSDEYPVNRPLRYGLQNTHYTADGRHVFRNNYDSNGVFRAVRRPMRRVQRRVRRLRNSANNNINSWLVPQYEYGSNSSNRSNSNSWGIPGNSNSNSNSSSSRIATREQLNYVRNDARVNANKAKNNKSSNRIKWEEQTVNNLPNDPVTLNVFSNGQKAVKIHRTANHYMSPQTFRSIARMSMIEAFNKHGNTVLFKSPMTRQNVRRADIRFVILKNKNRGRATKAKKNAANKIGDAWRRKLKRKRSQ